VWRNGRAFACDRKGRFRSRVRISADLLPGNSLGQAALTHLMFLRHPAVYVGTDHWAVTLLARKVTTGLAESNGSLPPGRWLEVTCLYTVISSGPNATQRVRENITLTYLHVNGQDHYCLYPVRNLTSGWTADSQPRGACLTELQTIAKPNNHHRTTTSSTLHLLTATSLFRFTLLHRYSTL